VARGSEKWDCRHWDFAVQTARNAARQTGFLPWLGGGEHRPPRLEAAEMARFDQAPSGKTT
jgi:hypothetical protein